MLANLAKMWRKAKSGDFGAISSRLLTKYFKRIYQQGYKGPENVGEFGKNGESGESGDFGEIWSRLWTKCCERIY